MINDRIAIGYVRLSRDDTKDGAEPIEVRLERRKNIVLRLAESNKIDLREENIFIERGSGTSIDKRPVFLQILALIEQGRVSHLLAPALDRLIRPGKSDEYRVEEIWKRCRVTVIVGDSMPLPFGERDFDVLHGFAYRIQAALGFQEIAKYSKRLRDTNTERALEGKKSGGYAVYGYRWVPAVWQGKALLAPGRYETVKAEYDIICEVFRRVRNEGMYSIVRDLNERYRATGVPAPSGLSRKGKGDTWRTSGLRLIIMNPFYAGFPAHRVETTTYGDGTRALPREEWTLAQKEQDYEHPVTMAEWEDLTRLVSERGTVLKSNLKKATLPGAPVAMGVHSHRETMLTGTIRCINGFKMQGCGRAYECKCFVEQENHPQRSIRKVRAEGAVMNILREALSALPDDFLGKTKKPDDFAVLSARRHQATLALQKEREVCSRLIRDADNLRDRFQERYEEEVAKCFATSKALEQEIAFLAEKLKHQNAADVLPVVAAIRHVGFETFWDAATMPERREIIGLFFERITVLPPPGNQHETRGIDVVMRSWVQPFYTPPNTVALSTRKEDWRTKHNLEVKALSNRGRRLRPVTILEGTTLEGEPKGTIVEDTTLEGQDPQLAEPKRGRGRPRKQPALPDTEAQSV